MTFLNHTLPERLNEFVESIFYYKDLMPDHTVERVIPTGHSYIIFELDDIPRNTFENETLEPNDTFTKVWVSGMHSQYLSISTHEKSEMLVIQLKPEGAYPYFHKKCSPFSNRVMPAQDLFGDSILELRESIYKVKMPKTKFKHVEAWLKKRFDNGRLPRPELVEVVNILKTAHDYQKAIAGYPKSQKHLIDQFKKYVGVTPKVFQRIMRFNEILNTVKKDGPSSWTDIAYTYGYSDQSHFIKEFRSFSGFSPNEFIKLDLKEGEEKFIPLDKEG